MDLFKLSFDDKYNLVLSIHWFLYALLTIIIILWGYRFFKNKLLFHKNVEIDSAEIGIQSQKIKIKPNYTNIDIAYKIWVELNTRKIGLPIDFEKDVIIEVYKSWFQFFGITRELIKELPATKLRNDKSTKELIELSTKILNEGLRPHLTSWQAKFHKWYEMEIKKDENINLTPQQVQQKYDDYQALKKDMSKINENLINYKNIIYKLAFGN
ncbi:hypothetical protein KUL156_21100 [Alteromonas sp. KUL156]|nr:hypothetical protein KUL154_19860 [Alteromonas sp. KUL154]GFD99517.1 hypothetical protein KUL156_21100 [Alteromonas sp. KUL156]